MDYSRSRTRFCQPHLSQPDNIISQIEDVKINNDLSCLPAILLRRDVCGAFVTERHNLDGADIVLGIDFEAGKNQNSYRNNDEESGVAVGRISEILPVESRSYEQDNRRTKQDYSKSEKKETGLPPEGDRGLE